MAQLLLGRKDPHLGYRRTYVSIILLGLLVLPIALFGALFDDTGKLLVVVAGILCLLALAFPLLLPGRHTSIYEPIIPMSICVLIGCTLRAFYLAYADTPRVPVLSMGQDYAEIARLSGWLILGLFSLGLGYAFTRMRLPLEKMRWLFERELSTGPRFQIAVVAALTVVLAATAIFIDAYGISFALDSISSKRTASIITEDGQEVFSSLGYIRVMSELGASALYYYVATLICRGGRFTLARILLLLLLFLASSAIPFLSSSRSEVGVIIINAAVLFLILGRTNRRMLILSIIAVVGIAFGMAQLRSFSQGELSYRDSESFVDTIVGSGNFVDLARTTAIINRVPQNVDYLYGASYLALLTAPIPKSLWPEKPNASLGPWVRSEVFGVWARNNGWPPNIIGEAYINFGYMGILLVPFLIGSLIRLIYNSFSPLLTQSPIASLLYTTLFWPIGILLIQLNFAQGIMIALQPLLSMTIFILLASRRATRSVP